jgi:hypothetical protein
MRKLELPFPGRGCKAVDMGGSLVEHYANVLRLFREASLILGRGTGAGIRHGIEYQ